MTAWLPYVVATGCVVVVGTIWRQWRVAVRAEFVRRYTLHKGIFDKLRAKHPDLTIKDCQLVTQALRQFFLV